VAREIRNAKGKILAQAYRFTSTPIEKALTIADRPGLRITGGPGSSARTLAESSDTPQEPILPPSIAPA
jgi:hypothetical protein